MNTEAIIIAVLGSNAATGALFALLLWGKRKFFERLDANKNETLEAVARLEAVVNIHAIASTRHAEQDTALFAEHDGAMRVLREGQAEMRGQISVLMAGRKE